MSLVAYDSSDESEEETKPVKKQKESVKILIPSLKEFENEEEKPIVKKPKLQSECGLFSLLPPPKNTLSANKSGFVPYILLSKKEKTLTPSTQSKNKTTPASSTLKTTPPPASASTISEDNESDDENAYAKDSSNNASSCDFFWLDDLASYNEIKVGESLSAPVKSNTFFQGLSSQLPCPSTSNIHQSYLKEMKEDVYLQKHQQLPPTDVNQAEIKTDDISSEKQSLLVEGDCVNTSSDDSKVSVINDKEFLKLQGRKREIENIDFIDVNADDQLTDRNNWLVKSVTEEMTHRSKKKHGLPTQQQKRKHQITYLAFQAKEREMDLKNQWSLNRLTRRETQSKYGF